MPKFKQNDKVVLLKDMDFAKKGTILTCIDNFVTSLNNSGEYYYCNKFADTNWVNRVPEMFKLADKEEIKSESFNLKTNPWFIQVNSKEEFEAAKEWVKSKGISFKYGDYWCGGIIAIGCSGVNSCIRVERGYLSEYDQKNEIKFLYKKQLVIDSVEYPVIESEQQKKIRELKETIEKASAQIAEIEKEMK